jgi:hypothetical protein
MNIFTYLLGKFRGNSQSKRDSGLISKTMASPTVQVKNTSLSQTGTNERVSQLSRPPPPQSFARGSRVSRTARPEVLTTDDVTNNAIVTGIVLTAIHLVDNHSHTNQDINIPPSAAHSSDSSSSSSDSSSSTD